MKLLRYLSIAILALIFIFVYVNRDGQILGKPYDVILQENDVDLDSVLLKLDSNNNDTLVFFDSIKDSTSSLGVLVLEKKLLRNYVLKDRGNYASDSNRKMHVSYLKTYPLYYGELKDKNINSVVLYGTGIEKEANIIKLSNKTIWYLEDLDFIPENVLIQGSNNNGEIIYSDRVFSSYLINQNETIQIC